MRICYGTFWFAPKKRSLTEGSAFAAAVAFGGCIAIVTRAAAAGCVWFTSNQDVVSQELQAHHSCPGCIKLDSFKNDNALRKKPARSLHSLYAIFMRVRIVWEKTASMIRSGTWHCGAGCAPVGVLVLAVAFCHAAASPPSTCQRVELEGEAAAGHEWKAPLGQNWVFRIVPIAPASAGYSGWDLVVDRDPPAGFPDALLLATLPYNSINEREIGTTFGLRAQDALGWNPRSFRFLTDPKDFREAQWLYLHLFRWPKDSTAEGDKAAMARLLEVEKGASSGQFRILDARLLPGSADPKTFALGWARAFSRTQHHIEPVAAGQASPQGKLVWMRFAVTLWFPSGWNFPAGMNPLRAPCPE